MVANRLKVNAGILIAIAVAIMLLGIVSDNLTGFAVYDFDDVSTQAERGVIVLENGGVAMLDLSDEEFVSASFIVNGNGSVTVDVLDDGIYEYDGEVDGFVEIIGFESDLNAYLDACVGEPCSVPIRVEGDVILSNLSLETIDSIQEEISANNLQITSIAFGNDSNIPDTYAGNYMGQCSGSDRSPPLNISGVPASTQALAIKVGDYNATSFDHWLIYWNGTSDVVIAEDSLPAGAVEGQNGISTNDYFGPCPPENHKYYYRIYALDTGLGLSAGFTRTDLDNAMSGHILEQTELAAWYPAGGVDTTAPVISSVANGSVTNESATITWGTDDSSNSSVRYSNASGYVGQTGQDDSVTSHSVELSGLINGTVYYYNVTSCNSENLCSTSTGHSLRTEDGPDSISPVITNVQSSSVTNQSATVTWSTDEDGNSTVIYGLADYELDNAAGSDSQVTSHNVGLVGLRPDSKYYYNVSSCDSDGNCNVSGTYTFITSANVVEGSCSGTISNSNCNQYGSQFDCEHTSGVCMWVGSCFNSGLTCSDVDYNSTCDSTSGCSWSQPGIDYSVSVYENQTYSVVGQDENATYEIMIVNDGKGLASYSLSVQNYNGAESAALSSSSVLNLNYGYNESVYLYVGDGNVGLYNVTVLATCSQNGSVQDITENITTNVTGGTPVSEIDSLMISKILLNGGTVYVNDIVQFMINVTNNGTSTLDNVWLFDDFNSSFLNFTGNSSCAIEDWNISDIGEDDGFADINVTQCLGQLAPNSSGQVYLNFTANMTGNTSNLARVSINYSEEGVLSEDSADVEIVDVLEEETGLSIFSIYYYNRTTSGVDVVWNTSGLSNSSVGVGVTRELDLWYGINDNVDYHNVTVSGLNHTSSYYLNVSSCTVSGLCNQSGYYGLYTKDVYEDDFNYSLANWIEKDGTIQEHGFYYAGDIDYMKFNATNGSTYVIETFVDSSADTMLYLLEKNGTTTIMSHDDKSWVSSDHPSNDLGSRIIWENDRGNGTYYIASWDRYDKYNFYNISVIEVGRLEPYLVSPNGDMSIVNGTYFNITTGVRCVGGYCDNVIAKLDPEMPAEKIEKEVEDKIVNEEKVRVIIKLREDKSKVGDVREAEIKKTQDEVLSGLDLKGEKKYSGIAGWFNQETFEEEYDLELRYRYETMSSLAGTVTQEGLEKLKQDPNVDKVYVDEIHHINMNTSAEVIGAPDVWVQQIDGMNLTGEGQTVCVIDSGVDMSHPFLQGRVLDEYCYCSLNDGCCFGGVNESFNGSDDNGHGTHVAGTVISNDTTYRGIAPGANIINIKACSSSGSCAESDYAKAAEWCIKNASKYNISVITMSVGGGWYDNQTECDEKLGTEAFNSAWNEGIFVSISAGNDDFYNGLEYPACGSNVTGVGATTDSDNLASFTNRNYMLDLMAPGVDIWSSCNGGGICNKQGTSMATPHVAGAAAVIKQKYMLEGYNISPSEILDKMQQSGVEVFDDDSYASYPRLNFAEVIAKGVIPEQADWNGVDPFYTITQNPNTGCPSRMNDGDVCETTWTVNSTRLGSWEFFTIYDNNMRYNITPKFNVNVVSGEYLDSITGLQSNSVTNESINWTWTNPGHPDFNSTIIYIDGANVANLSKPANSYNASGLEADTNYTITVHTKMHNGVVNDSDVNDTIQTLGNDIYPPAAVSGLEETNYTNSTITWNWTNPPDIDFNSSIVYLEGINVANVTEAGYVATGLIKNKQYQIIVHTKDTLGNVNTTDIVDNATTASYPDDIAPAAVTGLANISSTNETINISWTNPSDVDYAAAIVYVDGVNVANVSSPTNSYEATGLLENTEYNFTVHTKDILGNVNVTDISVIGKTQANPDTTPPLAVTGLYPSNSTNSTITWNWTLPVDLDFNSSIVYLEGINVANVTEAGYIATGLARNTTYTIIVHTKDHNGNVNTTDVQDTAGTEDYPDETPPLAITGLVNSSHTNESINWTWTNPSDVDFNSSIVYIDGVNVVNVSDSFYNAEGLVSNTSYTIRVNTKDNAGNVNLTNVENTASTQENEDWIPPVISNIRTSSIQNDSLRVLFDVDELANATIEYGTTVDLGLTTVDASFRIYHDIILTNLQEDTIYYYNVTACDSEGNCETSGLNSIETAAIPTNTDFNVSEGSTDFGAVDDVTNITNLTLANSNGIIQFSSEHSVNSDGEDYDANIEIGDSFISVNSTALDETFNTSVNLTMRNVNCPAIIYYGPGVFASAEAVIGLGNVCDGTTDPACTNIVCEDNVVTFTVSHFTAFASTGSTQMTIWDETDEEGGRKEINGNETVKFFANYTNNSGEILDGANCSISFDDLSSSMYWNGVQFEYSRNFSTDGIYDWNVTCNKSGYNVLSQDDEVNISPVGYPKYSEFDTSYGTTDFYSVNISNVTNLTLANQYGKINFPDTYSIDTEHEDYDAYVNIGTKFISVDSINLDPSFNGSANITLEGVSCPASLFYGDGTYTSANSIVSEGKVCDGTTSPSCTSIVCEENTISFVTSHFTGFAASSTTQLSIWDETDQKGGSYTKFAGQPVRFFANYTNATGDSILDGNCSIEFNDSTADMYINSTWYEYVRQFSAEANYTWNVTCNHTSYSTLNATDIVVIGGDRTPRMHSLTMEPIVAMFGTQINITSFNASHDYNSTLQLRCGNESGVYNLCNSTYGDPERNCSFNNPWTDDSAHFIYCVVSNGSLHSVERQAQLTADNTPPSLGNIQNVDGDTDIDGDGKYWDTSDNGQTVVQINYAESDIMCRFDYINHTYDDMNSSYECNVVGTFANCNLTPMNPGQFNQSYAYISCQDEYGNDQSNGNVINLSYGVDWTRPTVTSNNNFVLNAPGYVVNLTIFDIPYDSIVNVSYCVDQNGTCEPSTSFQGPNGTSHGITFNNRGDWYLRWNASDEAGNFNETKETIVFINDIFNVSESMFTNLSNHTVFVDVNASDPDNQSISCTLYHRKGNQTTTATDGNLSCMAVDGACSAGYTPIIHMNARSDAHAELVNNSDYNVTVCCIDTLGSYNITNNSGTNFLDLALQTNSHVELPGTTIYPFDARIGLENSPNESISCSYPKTNGTCSTGTCLATVSTALSGGDTNLHIADCITDPYETSVCCEIVTGIEENFSTKHMNLTTGVPYDGMWRANLSQAEGYDLDDIIETYVACNDTIEWVNNTPIVNISLPNMAPAFNESRNISNITWWEDTSNSSLNLSFHFYDLDGDILTFWNETAVLNISISINQTTGIVNFTPDANFTGIRYIRFNVTDNRLWSNYSNNITLYVLPVNDPPTTPLVDVYPENPRNDQDLICNVTNTSRDEENDTIYYWFTWFRNETYAFDYRSDDPSETFHILDRANTSDYENWNCTVVATDNESNSSQDSDIVFIANFPPDFDLNLTNQSLFEDETFIYDINCSDINGDNITYHDNTSLFDINLTTGLIVDSPDEHEVGNHSINITCQDVYGNNNSQRFNYEIKNLNPAFNPMIPNLVGQQDIYWEYDVNSTDDTDNLTWYINTTMVSIDNLSGLMNDTAIESEWGHYSVNVTVVDMWNFTNTSIFTYYVNDTNPPAVTLIPPTALHGNRSIENFMIINASLDEVNNLTGCVVEWDNETDQINYTMTLNGTLCNITLPTEDSINYTFRVWANDGNLNWNSSETRVFRENNEPSIDFTEIVPDPSHMYDTLTCEPQWNDTDNDTASYYYRWFNDSILVAGEETSQYNCTSLGCAKFSNITCEALPWDGYENGTPINGTQFINNSNPAIYLPSVIFFWEDGHNDSINLSEEVLDVDNDVMDVNWSYSGDTTNLTIIIDNVTKFLNISADPDWNGTRNVTFYAFDPDGGINWTIHGITVKVNNTNDAPTWNTMNLNPNRGKLGAFVNITSINAEDIDGDNITLRCGNADFNWTLCNSTPQQPEITCGFNSPWSDDSQHTVFCRLYDSYNDTVYSYIRYRNFTSDNTPPYPAGIETVASDSLEGEFWDTVDDNHTLIIANVTEVGTDCRFDDNDIGYDAMDAANNCTVFGTVVECNITNLPQAVNYSYHLACRDAYYNGQNSTQNTDFLFSVDWTAPTTSDSHAGGIHLPGYQVTINESDIPNGTTIFTWYCLDQSGNCTPTIPIDDGENVTFNVRGVNHLRYYSNDSATPPNEQAPVRDTTVLINELVIVEQHVTTNITHAFRVDVNATNPDTQEQNITCTLYHNNSDEGYNLKNMTLILGTQQNGTWTANVTPSDGYLYDDEIEHYVNCTDGMEWVVDNKTNNTIPNLRPDFIWAEDGVEYVAVGDQINITTYSYDNDSDSLVIYVCNSTLVSYYGCSDTQYCMQNGSLDNASCNFTAEPTQGLHTWYAFIYDSMGAVSDRNHSGNYTTDITPPTVNLMLPLNNAFTGDTQPSFQFNSTDNYFNVTNCSLYLNNTWNATNSSVEDLVPTNLSSTVLDGGLYEWKVNCTDGVGNEGTSAIWNITIDTKPPLSNITDPTDQMNITLGQNYNITGLASDEFGVNLVQVNISGTLYNVVGTDSWNYTWELTDGRYVLSSRATDNAGNVENVTEYIVVYVYVNSTINNSETINSTLINSTVINSSVINSTINNSNVTNSSSVINSSITNSTLNNVTSNNCTIINSNLTDSECYDSIVIDSSGSGWYIDPSLVERSVCLGNCTVTDSNVADCTLNHTALNLTNATDCNSLGLNTTQLYKANITSEQLYSGNMTYDNYTYDADVLPNPWSLRNIYGGCGDNVCSSGTHTQSCAATNNYPSCNFDCGACAVPSVSGGGGGGGGGGSARACNDGRDNDGDGLIDMDDPGCEDKYDTDELDPPACRRVWACTPWTGCTVEGYMTRTCWDDNDCDREVQFGRALEIRETAPPDEFQECEYVEPVECEDADDCESGFECLNNTCIEVPVEEPREAIPYLLVFQERFKSVYDIIEDLMLGEGIPFAEKARTNMQGAGIDIGRFVQDSYVPFVQNTFGKGVTAVKESGFFLKPYSAPLVYLMVLIVLLIGGMMAGRGFKKTQFYQRYTQHKAEVEEEKRKAQEEKLAAEHALHKEEYAERLNDFINDSIHKGYTKRKILLMLKDKGWSFKAAKKYVDEYFAANKQEIMKIKNDIAEIRSDQESDYLNIKMQKIDEEIEKTPEYLKNDLPKKWKSDKPPQVKYPTKKVKYKEIKPDDRVKKLEAELSKLDEELEELK